MSMHRQHERLPWRQPLATNVSARAPALSSDRIYNLIWSGHFQKVSKTQSLGVGQQ